MSRHIDIDQNEDHIGGNFEWETPPDCCGLLKAAVDDEKFVFVSNFTSEGFNSLYMLPVTSDGFLARSNGLPISHCPWCGTEIKVRKKYPKTR